MTNGVSGIGGNPFSYGNYGYNNNHTGEAQEKAPEIPVKAPETRPVDEETVMKFLEANNLRVVPKTVTPVEFDPKAQERIEGYMARFDEIMRSIEDEFGPELAPLVMDMVMDRLMGMV